MADSLQESLYKTQSLANLHDQAKVSSFKFEPKEHISRNPSDLAQIAEAKVVSSNKGSFQPQPDHLDDSKEDHDDDDDDDNDIDDDNDDSNEAQSVYNKLKSFSMDNDLLDDERMDRGDFRQIMNPHHIDADIVELIFDAIDTNKDSFITINEYMSWRNALSLSSMDRMLSEHAESAPSQHVPAPDFIAQTSANALKARISELSAAAHQLSINGTDLNGNMSHHDHDVEVELTTISGQIEEEKYPSKSSSNSNSNTAKVECARIVYALCICTPNVCTRTE